MGADEMKIGEETYPIVSEQVIEGQKYVRTDYSKYHAVLTPGEALLEALLIKKAQECGIKLENSNEGGKIYGC